MSFTSVFFGIEFALSIAIMVFLINLTLLIKIRYGSELVTKLTELPYIVSLCLVAMIIVYLGIGCFLANITFVEQHGTFYYLMITPGTTYNTISCELGVIKISLGLL